MHNKPGVADNKSYKDTYHFNDNFYSGNNSNDLPSINIDPKINDSIKENPYRSNVEIEGDEVVLKPDLSALFKAKGKKHSNGGMDVLLEPNSFVFSDDKSLSFTKKDHKAFEFKEGGTFKASKNTPADVLKRNVDAKHYNKLIANITDVKKDDLTKKSSTMMLEKYIEKLGQIAYLQESKKQFPTGVPSFSENTAPVYQPDVKADVLSQKQYAKYGGKIENPYMEEGGDFPEYESVFDCRCGINLLTGKCNTPCSQEVLNREFATAPRVDKLSPGYNPVGNDPAGRLLGEKLIDPKYDYTQKKNMTDAAWRAHLAQETPQEKAARHAKERIRQLQGKPDAEYQYVKPEMITPKGPLKRDIPSYANPNLVPTPVEGEAQTGRDINWEFNKYQRESQGYNLAKLASAKRYMPTRSQLLPSYMDPSLVNPEQAVGDMQGASNQQIDSLSSLSPILRNAQASQFNGQLMDRIGGIRSQYDNQNAQIIGQNRGMNNQIANNARSVNMQNDQNYYKESVIGQQNFNNLQTFQGDQYMNNRMQDVTDNQSLAFNLATMNNPAFDYDFRNMNFRRNSKDIRDVGRSGQDNYSDLLQEINKIPDATERIKQRIQLEKIKKFQGLAKKGGTINPYK